MGIYDFYYTSFWYKGRTIPCLVFETRHNKALVETLHSKNLKVFGLRHSDNDWSEPVTLEENVLVNFFGYMAVNMGDINIFHEELSERGFIDINSKRLYF